jgi:hypothetical protein
MAHARRCTRKVRTRVPSSSPDPLRRVKNAWAAKHRAEQECRDAAQAARQAGYTFTAIAQAAGVSRQAARKLLTPKEKK